MFGRKLRETIQNVNAAQGGDIDVADGASRLDLVVSIGFFPRNKVTSSHRSIIKRDPLLFLLAITDLQFVTCRSSLV